MKIEQINQVLSLSRTGSFTESARLLYMSQPNLSQSIKQLETELGRPLFQRTNAGLVMTDFGKEYLHYIQSVKNDLDRMDSFCSTYPAKSHYSLNIVVNNCSWTFPYFSKVVSDYEKLPLDFSLFLTGNHERAEELIQSGVCDLALIGISGSTYKQFVREARCVDLEVHHVHSSPIHVMIGEKNPYYNALEMPPLEEFARFPYVGYGDYLNQSEPMLLKEIGISHLVNSTIRVNANAALYNVLKNTEAFTFSANTKGCMEQPGIRSFRLPGNNFTVEYCWIKLKRHSLSDAGTDFIDSITDFLQEE